MALVKIGIKIKGKIRVREREIIREGLALCVAVKYADKMMFVPIITKAGDIAKINSFANMLTVISALSFRNNPTNNFELI